MDDGQKMPRWICVACGTAFPPSRECPPHCPICEDQRQYVPSKGQLWTTMEEITVARTNVFRFEEPGLTSIVTSPRFAIGQRALLVQTPDGGVFWDCLNLIDQETIREVRERVGQLRAIALSHPHFYASMVDWSRAFGGTPIYVHADDQQWLMRPDKAIIAWQGDTCQICPEITLVRCGGHFNGASVMHWRSGAEGKGALFTSDTIKLVSDRRYVSFMYSYPNLIPLSAPAIGKIRAAVLPLQYHRLYGAWLDEVISSEAASVVERSCKRYLGAILTGGVL